MAGAATVPDDDGPLASPDRWLRRNAPVDPASRVPLFAEAMGSVASAWTHSFCGLSASEGEIVFKGLRPLTVQAAPLGRESLPIFAALRAPGWNAAVGLGLDRVVISTVVESFFGGGDGETATDGRPVSPVEMRIVDVIGGQAASALSAGLSEIQPIRIEFDRTMPKPECLFLGKAPTALLAARFALTTLGRTVELDLLFPQAVIDANATTWAGTTPAAPVLDPAGWTRQLRSEVSRATLRVEAEIALRPMNLGALASLRAGQVLELPAGAGTNVLLRCGEERLFRCHLGQSAGCYTVRIDGTIERDPQSPHKGH